MASVVRLLALAALVAGVALLGYAIGAGSAHLSLVVIFPVVSGSSLPFALGVLLTFAGIIGLMTSLSIGQTFDLEEDEETPNPRSKEAASGPRSAAAGVVLIGPLPIFFGAAKPASRRYYLLALLAAVVLFAAVLVLAWVL